MSIFKKIEVQQSWITQTTKSNTGSERVNHRRLLSEVTGRCALAGGGASFVGSGPRAVRRGVVAAAADGGVKAAAGAKSLSSSSHSTTGADRFDRTGISNLLARHLTILAAIG